MEVDEAKKKFIQSWGTLGSSWGINKTMAQINALLLLSPEPLSTDDIMAELNISRGNANMNTRALIDWGIVHKEYKSGDRKEYFMSEKDVWAIAASVARERRKRELEPVLRMLNQVKDVEGEGAEVEEFKKMTIEVESMAQRADTLLDKVSKADKHWFTGALLKLLK